jgi:hypothetical protein
VSNKRKMLAEAMAIRYMDLAGLKDIQEEVDIEKIYQPVEDAAAGGENLVNPIDHVGVVTDEENVKGVETQSLVDGEVSVVEDLDIEKIVKEVRFNMELERILEKK